MQNNRGTKWPLLAVEPLWPLICLKSPKQQRGVTRFYCPRMGKGDIAALAWWMGSNWESEAGIKELYPTIKLCCSQLSRTQNLLWLSVYVWEWVCVWVTGKLCYQSESYTQDRLQQLDIKQYIEAHNTQFSLCALLGSSEGDRRWYFSLTFSIDCWVKQPHQTKKERAELWHVSAVNSHCLN